MKKLINKFIVIRLIIINSLLFSCHVFAAPLPEIDCLIEPNKTIELSSSVTGVLDDVLVDRSDSIKKDQILARLKSNVVQVEVRSSQEKVNLSKAEYKRALELFADNVITRSEKELADNQLKLYELELEQAKASLDQRILRSPIDAVIVDRYRMPGEYVNDSPIFKIAQLDPLRVEIISSVEHFGQIEKGMHAHVETEFGGYKNLVAKVVLVDQVIDAASGTFGVRLELPNKDNEIPGGLKCKILFFNNVEEAEYLSLYPPENASVDSYKNTQDELDRVDLAMQSGQMGSCHSIGPFDKKAKMLALMKKLDSAIQHFESRDEMLSTTYYLVSSASFKTKKETRDLIARVKKIGIKDIAMLMRKSGPSLSYGLYKNKNIANARQLKLSKLGFDSRVIPQKINKTMYWADVLTDKTELALAEAVNNKKLKVQSCSVKI